MDIHKYSLFVIYLVGLVFSLNSSSASSSVIFDDDQRYINGAFGTQQESGGPFITDDYYYNPSSPFADFTASDSVGLSGTKASASASSDQISSLTPMFFTATGNVAASALSGVTSQAVADSNSIFSIDFSLDSTYFASLTGSLFRSVDPGDGSLTTHSFVSLVDVVTSTQLYLENASSGSALSFAEDLLLGPSSYRLRVESYVDSHLLQNIDVSGTANYEMQFSLTSIPEPTTLALLSLGLAGLGFTRRKMKV